MQLADRESLAGVREEDLAEGIAERLADVRKVLETVWRKEDEWMLVSLVENALVELLWQ